MDQFIRNVTPGASANNPTDLMEPTGDSFSDFFKSSNQIQQEAAYKKALYDHAEAQINRDWNAEQAKKAMDYQTEMSNTAIQRRMADLNAAGLNPVLAAGQAANAPSGIASSGSAAQASANNSGSGGSAFTQSIGNILTSAIKLVGMKGAK